MYVLNDDTGESTNIVAASFEEIEVIAEEEFGWTNITIYN